MKMQISRGENARHEIAGHEMQDMKIEGMKHYCLLALHLPGASSQRFDLM